MNDREIVENIANMLKGIRLIELLPPNTALVLSVLFAFILLPLVGVVLLFIYGGLSLNTFSETLNMWFGLAGIVFLLVAGFITIYLLKPMLKVGYEFVTYILAHTSSHRAYKYLIHNHDITEGIVENVTVCSDSVSIDFIFIDKNEKRRRGRYVTSRRINLQRGTHIWVIYTPDLSSIL